MGSQQSLMSQRLLRDLGFLLAKLGVPGRLQMAPKSRFAHFFSKIRRLNIWLVTHDGPFLQYSFFWICSQLLQIQRSQQSSWSSSSKERINFHACRNIPSLFHKNINSVCVCYYTWNISFYWKMVLPLFRCRSLDCIYVMQHSTIVIEVFRGYSKLQ